MSGLAGSVLWIREEECCCTLVSYFHERSKDRMPGGVGERRATRSAFLRSKRAYALAGCTLMQLPGIKATA